MHWRPVIDLYCVSYRLYTDAGRQEQATIYLNLYHNWLQKLEADGLNVRSVYEAP
jgi:hypothetical protein